MKEGGKNIMAILTSYYDVDLEENVSKLYRDAQETIKYLQDLCASIERRVETGEFINGFKIKETKGNRFITPKGEVYLEKVLGKDKVYKTTVKFIGITDLSKLIEADEMESLILNGFVDFKPGKKVVEVDSEQGK